MSARSLAARIAKLEQAHRPSVFVALWTECADAFQAQIDAGSTDPDLAGIVLSLRRWCREGVDRR